MSIAGKVINDIFDAVEDLVSFFIIYSLILFCLGIFWGAMQQGTEVMWWPIYLLFIALFIKTAKDLATS